MRRLYFLTLLLLLLVSVPSAAAQDQPGAPENGVGIRAPAGGEALQGNVSIQGWANPDDFFAYELAFAYSGDPSGAWFLIDESFNPVEDGVLAEWDTFPITDGIYDLRLQVTLRSGETLTIMVEGLRVRNYTQVETSTPTPVPSPTVTPTVDLTAVFTPEPPTSTPTEPGPPTAVPTGTPLPENPAVFNLGDITYSLARGAAGVLAAFILIGMYISLRNLRR